MTNPKDKLILIHQRMFHDSDHTMGYLVFDNKINYILEDPPQKIKLAGKTRIPAGIYEIKQRKVLSPLTKKYREKYSWFNWHLEFQDVPNFEHVYSHIGNYATDTDGCQLHGLTPTNPRIGRVMVENSTLAFIEYYKYITNTLENGGQVFIDVRNEII